MPTIRQSIPLVLVLALAAILRLTLLGSSPEGVHADEASNVWNASCLASMLADEHGEFLPVFYTRAFNDNRSALFLYVLAPFVGAGGMSPWAFRLPGALSGVASCALIYLIIRRLAGERVALLAGLLLAIDPTLVQQTRWAHEASITPMLVLGCIALWQASGLLWARTARPSVVYAIVAGAVTGLACYAYGPVRIYLPLLLIASLIVSPIRKEAIARRATIGAACGFLVLFLPLLWQHLTDPAINERARATWVWASDDSVGSAAMKVVGRYFEHYSPEFLFRTGTEEATLASPDPLGALSWISAPLLVIGLIRIVRTARSESLARLALIALMLYPAGDLLNAAGNANVLRSLCGWWAFALVAAIGIEQLAHWSGRRATIMVSVTSTIAIGVSLLHFSLLIRERNVDPLVQSRLGADFRDACQFIASRRTGDTVIVFTTTRATYCYPQVLIALNYEPRKYFASRPSFVRMQNPGGPEPELLLSSGNLFFLHPVEGLDAAIADAIRTARSDTSLWVLRPEEARSDDRVIYTAKLSDGTESLKVIERRR